MMPLDQPGTKRLRRPWIAAVAVASIALALPAAASANVPYKQIVTPGPLTRIAIGEELSCQVKLGQDSDFSFYPQYAAPGDCGAMVYENGVLYGPDWGAHTDTATSSSPVGLATPFNAVSQTGPVGSGTTSSPWQITTVGTTPSFEVTRIDRYVPGGNSWNIELRLKNTSASPQDMTAYHAGDCYLAGADRGYGIADGPSGSVFCTSNPNNNPAGRVIGFGPSKLNGVPGANFIEGVYDDDVWDATNGSLYPNTCRCAQREDNGIGLSWRKTNVQPNEVVVISLASTVKPPPTPPTCMGRTATRYGNNAANVLTGTPKPDVIVGMGGNDTIRGLGKGDVVCAGPGNDVVYGSAGSDILRGEGGRDRLVGGGGKDKLIGGRGRDRLVGGGGKDKLIGGGGNDRLVGGGGNDKALGGAGKDILIGKRRNDVLKGGPGRDRLKGGPGRDRCVGGGGKDRAAGCEIRRSI